MGVGEYYPSAEVQSVNSTDPAGWAKTGLNIFTSFLRLFAIPSLKKLISLIVYSDLKKEKMGS